MVFVNLNDNLKFSAAGDFCHFSIARKFIFPVLKKMKINYLFSSF